MTSSIPAPVSARHLMLEGVLACAAFLAGGFFVSAYLTKSWTAYERTVVPAEAHIDQASKQVRARAIALASLHRLPAPTDQVADAMRAATLTPGEEPVARALASIERLSLVQPLPVAFVQEATRLMHIGQVEHQLHKQQLMDSLRKYDAESPLLGRAVSHAYLVLNSR